MKQQKTLQLVPFLCTWSLQHTTGSTELPKKVVLVKLRSSTKKPISLEDTCTKMQQWWKGMWSSCWVWVCILPGYAQTLRFTNYDVDEGIPSSEVYQVRKHSSGAIWFATDRGVGYLDGDGVRTFNANDGLEDITVFAINEDASGDLWFPSLSGAIFTFDGTSFHRYPHPTVPQNSLAADQITSLASRSDTLWIGTHRNGIFRSDPNGDLTQITHARAIYGYRTHFLSIDSSQLVFGRSEQIMNRDALSLTVELLNKHSDFYDSVTLTLAQRSHIFQGNYLGMAPLGDQHVLVATDFELHVVHRNGVTQRIGPRTNWLSASLFVDKDGLIWAGSKSDGVYVFDPERNYEIIGHYLSDLSVSSITQDDEGGYWLSTLESGIFYTPGNTIRVYMRPNRLRGENISKLVVEDSALWIVTVKYGIHQLTPHENPVKATISAHFTDEEEPVTLFMLDGGYRIMQSQNATVIYKNDKLVGTYPSAGGLPFRIERDELWLLGANGFNKLNLKTQILSRKLWRSGFVSRISTGVLDQEGRIWIGTVSGLFFKNGEDVVRQKLPFEKPGLRIKDLYYRDSTLYVATLGQGAYRIALNQQDTRRITTEDGLASNNCTAVYPDDYGRIWVGTDKGLSVFEQRDSTFVHKKTLTVQDGLTSRNINDLEALNGHLWIATNNGLNSLPLNNVLLNEQLPTVRITSRHVLTLKTRLPITEPELRYNENNLHISFRSIAFRNNGNVNYRYRLVGLDSLYTPTTDNFVQLNSIPPGEYTFIVQAQNSDGLWGEPAQWYFSITPPFWATWWFIGLSIAATIGGLIELVGYRYRLVHERTSLRLKIAESEQVALYAQLNPHFIYNALNSVQYYLSHHMGLKAADYIARFSVLIRGVLEHSQHSYITIEKELEHLKLYLELERERFEEKFNFSITVAPEVNPTTRIPAMVIQPLVENAIWHGLMHRGDANGILDIQITRQGYQVQCSIRDNGIGRERSRQVNASSFKQHTSYGTTLIRNRLKVLNQYDNRAYSLVVRDLYTNAEDPAGTEVVFTVTDHYAKLNGHHR